MVNIIIQNRDVKILNSLAGAGALIIDQISKLHFSGKKEATIKRIQKLCRAGFIKKLPQLPGGLCLSKGARAVLLKNGIGIKAVPNQYQWKHHLMTMDVKIAIETQFPELYPQIDCSPRSLVLHGNIIKPDLVTVFKSDDSSSLVFIEVDRGTESIQIILGKVRAYSSLLRRSKYSKRASQILFVVPTEQRRLEIVRAFISLPSFILRTVTVIGLLEITEMAWDPLGKLGIKNTPSDETSVEQ